MNDTIFDNGPLPQDVALRMIPVIRRIAHRVARRLPRHICMDDLTSAGFIGLITAYRRFDPARTGDFLSYAELRVRGAMIDELRACDPLSRDLRAHANRMAIAARDLGHRLGRAPREDELAAELGLSIEAFQVYASKVAVGPTISLDTPADSESHFQFPDASATPADERIWEEESKQAIGKAMEALPARLRLVVELYYRDERTLKEIGAMLGVTESRVCQLQGEAIQRMRAHCGRHATNAAPASPKVRAARTVRQEMRRAA